MTSQTTSEYYYKLYAEKKAALERSRQELIKEVMLEFKLKHDFTLFSVEINGRLDRAENFEQFESVLMSYMDTQKS